MRGLLAAGYLVLTGGPRGETLTLTPPLNIPEELILGVGPALRAVLAA
jgi:4-aminobutyrate aminotransferase/(S)-3-amino-2-methylpropionate transaminase